MLKLILPAFDQATSSEVYAALRDYFAACLDGLESLGASETISKPIVFKALSLLFPEVAQRVSDRYNGAFSASHFAAVLKPVFGKARATMFTKAGQSHKSLHQNLSQLLRQQFVLSKRA